MTQVTWDPEAEDFLNDLQHDIKARILKKIDKDIRADPRRFIEHVEGRDSGKIRIGDYRLFVDYLQDRDELRIRAMWHRKNAYKRT